MSGPISAAGGKEPGDDDLLVALGFEPDPVGGDPEVTGGGDVVGGEPRAAGDQGGAETQPTRAISHVAFSETPEQAAVWPPPIAPPKPASTWSERAEGPRTQAVGLGDRVDPGATQAMDLGVTQAMELGDLGATQAMDRSELGATQATNAGDLGATQAMDLGDLTDLDATQAMDRDDLGATQAMNRSELGAAQDVGRTDFDVTRVMPGIASHATSGDGAPTERFVFAGLRPTEHSEASAPNPFEELLASQREATAPPTPPARPRVDAEGAGRGTRALIWVAAGLAGALILAGLFYLGTQLAAQPETAPVPPVAAPSQPATPTQPAGTQPAGTQPTTPSTGPDAPAVPGPVAAGEHRWDTLQGGECLQPFTSPWEEIFTVVDCDEPHAAQLVGTGEFDADAEFPGEEALAEQINVLCSTPDVIDFDAAGEYSDIQLDGSYPVTAEQWSAGMRSYYCFVSRAGGEELTQSLAAAHD